MLLDYNSQFISSCNVICSILGVSAICHNWLQLLQRHIISDNCIFSKPIVKTNNEKMWEKNVYSCNFSGLVQH